VRVLAGGRPVRDPHLLVDAVTVLDCGCGEPFKRAYHVALLALFAGAAIYNALAWGKRREPHLALMTGLYVVGVVGERYVCQQHQMTAADLVGRSFSSSRARRCS